MELPTGTSDAAMALCDDWRHRASKYFEGARAADGSGKSQGKLKRIKAYAWLLALDNALKAGLDLSLKYFRPEETPKGEQWLRVPCLSVSMDQGSDG